MGLLFLILFDSKKTYQNFVLQHHFKCVIFPSYVTADKSRRLVSATKEYLPHETRVEKLMNKEAVTPESLELTKIKTGI